MGGGAAAGGEAAGWRSPRRPRAGCPRRRSQPARLPLFLSPWRGSKGLNRPRATVSTAPSSRRDRQQRASAPARSRRGDQSLGCATGARQASRRHRPLLPVRIPAFPTPPGLSPSAPAGSALRCRGLRGAWRRGKDPCRGRGAGAGFSAVSSRGWRATLTLGEHLSHPPRRQEKFFFPQYPSPTPHPLSGWGGFGSIGEKSHTFPSAAPPPGDRAGGGGWGEPGGWRRGGPTRTSSSSAVATRAVRPGAEAQLGARRRLPPSVRVCVPGSGSIQPALFLPAAPQ